MPGDPLKLTINEQPGFTFTLLPLLPRPFIQTASTAVRGYDIHPDGKRFIGLVAAGQGQAGASGQPSTPQIQVVLNWFEDVKRRVAR